MADIAKFIEEIKGMTVVELNELVKALEEEFGVSAAAPVAVAAAPAAGAAAPAEEEKTEFNVKLKGVQRQAQGDRREEDRGHQGCPRVHLPRPRRSEEARRRSRHDQGRRQQGRGREDRRPHERGRRGRRHGVISAAIRTKRGTRSGLPFLYAVLRRFVFFCTHLRADLALFLRAFGALGGREFCAGAVIPRPRRVCFLVCGGAPAAKPAARSLQIRFKVRRRCRAARPPNIAGGCVRPRPARRARPFPRPRARRWPAR